MQEIPLKCKKKLFYCASGQALAQVAQRGYVVSILGDTQYPTRHGPEQPILNLPCFELGTWTR